jgi:hypothetical protein
MAFFTPAVIKLAANTGVLPGFGVNTVDIISVISGRLMTQEQQSQMQKGGQVSSAQSLD